MMASTPCWLWLEETNGCAIEILNENRTNAYAPLNPYFSGTSGAGCRFPVLDRDPCDLAEIDYTAPDDGLNPAPWFTSADPGSGSFLGFYLETVTGLDGAHWARGSNQRALAGANISALRAGGRELAFEVIAIAKNREGLEYGRRWLEYQLAATCDPCMTYRAYVRLFPVDLGGRVGTEPDFEAVAKRGLFYLTGVGMMRGPTWTDPPLLGAESCIQRLTFTLFATEPCLAACPTVVLDQVTESTWNPALLPGCIPFDQWLCGPTDDYAPVCGEVPASPAGARTSVQIRLDAPSGTPNMAVSLIMNPQGLACDDTHLPPPCAHMVVKGLDAGASVIIDGGAQQVLYRPLPDSPWVPGDFLILPLEELTGGFSWPSFGGCIGAWAKVVPYAHCGLHPDVKISVTYQQYEGC